MDFEDGLGLPWLRIPALSLYDVSIPAVCRWIGAFVVAEWLRIPDAMRTLMALMVIDYGTGLVAAWQKGDLSSSRAKRGLTVKILILVLLYVAKIVEQQAEHTGLNIHFVSTGGAYAYIVSEGISIVENVTRAGVPVPAAVVTRLMAFKKLFKMATPEQIEQLSHTDEPKAKGQATGK